MRPGSFARNRILPILGVDWGGSRMREIKFRAWSKEQQSMWSVDSLHFLEKTVDMFRYEKNKMTNKTERISNFRFPYPKAVILMQYTGLKDKNGKEIFDGDIVKWKQSLITAGVPKKPRTRIDVVKCYDLSHCQPLSLMSVDETKNIKVIGNIYKNPELLTQ